MGTRMTSTPGVWYRRGAVTVLTLVAAIGAVLSWGSLYLAASVGLGKDSPTWHGVNLVGAAFPLLLDALILGASLRYIGGVKAGRPVAGWRIAAHSAIAGTIVLNAAAADTAAHIPWHVVAPAVWSLIVELYARDVLGELREVRKVDTDRIPARLWITAPGESIRTSWRMARTGQQSTEVARVEADRCAAARDALRRAIPGAANRRTRRQITRRLWAGSINPTDVFTAIGWTGDVLDDCDPEVVLRAALRAVLAPTGATEPPAAGGPVPPQVLHLIRKPSTADPELVRMLRHSDVSIRAVKTQWRVGHKRAVEMLAEARTELDQPAAEDDEDTHREGARS